MEPTRLASNKQAAAASKLLLKVEGCKCTRGVPCAWGRESPTPTATKQFLIHSPEHPPLHSQITGRFHTVLGALHTLPVTKCFARVADDAIATLSQNWAEAIRTDAPCICVVRIGIPASEVHRSPSDRMTRTHVFKRQPLYQSAAYAERQPPIGMHPDLCATRPAPQRRQSSAPKGPT